MVTLMIQRKVEVIQARDFKLNTYRASTLETFISHTYCNVGIDFKIENGHAPPPRPSKPGRISSQLSRSIAEVVWDEPEAPRAPSRGASKSVSVCVAGLRMVLPSRVVILSYCNYVCFSF